ncbi:MAG: deoxyhypusine synthase [Nanoarchaeota archaeon]|nr:deoxyhypusine synthase [Nanoarchaeota archaeon]
MTDKDKKARDSILKKSDDPKDLPEIKGYDFDSGLDFQRFLDSYNNVGFQASNLGKAIDIIKRMREEKEITIFLGFSSNMVTSGLRDIITYLVKHKMVHVLVTTVGGIEEDVIKTMKPFLLGRFDADGGNLRNMGINRTGNIFIPNDRYIAYEEFMNKFMAKMLERQKKEDVFCTSDFIKEMGKELTDESSYIYWASKNDIPVFCPAITDGSTGDMMYFFKKDNPDFKLDVTADIVRINDIALNAEKSGIISLGSGIMRHHMNNANLFREGADYAVYINSNLEFDGSDSGAKPEEAKSWGKITYDKDADKNIVKIYGDATIIFPLLVAGAFRK